MYNFFLGEDGFPCPDCDKCEEVTVEVKNDLLTSQCIRCEQWKIGLAKKCAMNKKSVIFIQLNWYFIKSMYPWASFFDKISDRLVD